MWLVARLAQFLLIIMAMLLSTKIFASAVEHAMQFVLLRHQKLSRKLEDLDCAGLKIFQDDDLYKFTSDAVLLANFFKAKKDAEVVELCSGSGVISILGSHKTRAKHFVCVELQSELADMCKESVKINHLDDKIDVINANLTDFSDNFHKKVDVVVVNPPYYCKNLANANDHFAVCTHEIETNLAEVCKASAKLLKFGGKLYMVHVAERFAEICYELKKNKLEPKKVVFVKPTKEKTPNVVLIEATMNAKVGLKIEEMLL